MALIAMTVYSTEENKKDECLKRTLESLYKTVDFTKHRLILSVNGSTKNTIEIINTYPSLVIINKENLGTAKGINKAWSLRKPGEHAIKMDDDILINYSGWVDEMEEAINRDPLIGQVGLKRKDVWEHPKHESSDLRSELIMLPHSGGERWIVVEKVKHVIGSCVMHSSRLIEKVGYMYQPSLYGYDDVLMSHRTHLAGFYSCFLPHINIDHIDNGDTPYQDWKHKHSAEHTHQVIDLVHQMYRGEKPIYYGL